MKNEMQVFLDSIRSICPELNENELGAFSEKLTLQTWSKKDFVVSSGQVQKELSFITSGLIRSFFIDNKGNEKTVRFISENDYVTHYTAFITQKPSKYTFQCLEDTTTVCLSYDSIQWAYSQFPKFERFGRLIAEEILKMQQQRIESFIFHTAEKRYLDFIDQNSELFNRISLSHLCSYLGIERQTLTRIRQKVARK